MLFSVCHYKLIFGQKKKKNHNVKMLGYREKCHIFFRPQEFVTMVTLLFSSRMTQSDSS